MVCWGELEHHRDVTELQVGVHEHDRLLAALGEQHRQVRGDHRLCPSHPGREHLTTLFDLSVDRFDPPRWVATSTRPGGDGGATLSTARRGSSRASSGAWRTSFSPVRAHAAGRRCQPSITMSRRRASAARCRASAAVKLDGDRERRVQDYHEGVAVEGTDQLVHRGEAPPGVDSDQHGQASATTAWSEPDHGDDRAASAAATGAAVDAGLALAWVPRRTVHWCSLSVLVALRGPARA